LRPPSVKPQAFRTLDCVPLFHLPLQMDSFLAGSFFLDRNVSSISGRTYPSFHKLCSPFFEDPSKSSLKNFPPADPSKVSPLRNSWKLPWTLPLLGISPIVFGVLLGNRKSPRLPFSPGFPFPFRLWNFPAFLIEPFLQDRIRHPFFPRPCFPAP